MKEISEMIFDKVILQIDWDNPRCMDKTGELVAITWESIDWDTRTWNFEFRSYEYIKGSLALNRLWMSTTKFSDEHATLFRDQALKLFKTITDLCKPISINRVGYRLISVYPGNPDIKKVYIERFLPLSNYTSLFGKAEYGSVRWKTQIADYKKLGTLEVSYAVLYSSKKTSEREELPEEGLVVDVDFGLSKFTLDKAYQVIKRHIDQSNKNYVSFIKKTLKLVGVGL